MVRFVKWPHCLAWKAGDNTTTIDAPVWGKSPPILTGRGCWYWYRVVVAKLSDSPATVLSSTPREPLPLNSSPGIAIPRFGSSPTASGGSREGGERYTLLWHKWEFLNSLATC